MCVLDGVEMFYRLPDAAAHASFEQHFNDNAGLWAKVKPKGHFVVRSYRQDADASKLPYELVAATPAIDMWALGCMLFQMVSGEELVPTDVNQDVTADSIHIAATWSDAKLCRRIESQVANQHAQDLLKHLLVVDPASRVSAAAVLDHPFLTGEPGHASTAVVHAFQDIQASHRDVEARLNLLLESAQTTDHLIQTARTQLTTLKQSVVRGVFDASEATVPTSFVVFPMRLTSAASSSHIEAAIAQHLRALLASVKSIAQATLRGDALAQVMTSLTNGQPLYLYLVDEVQGSIVLHDPNHIYPVEIHPQDTSFLAAVVPLLLDGLQAVARAQRATGQSNAAWFDAYDDIDALGQIDDMMATLWQGLCLRGAALRRLKLWLFEKDPTASFAGLERVLVADGLVRWTSHAQAQQLRGSAPFHAHDGKGSVGGMALLDMMLDVTTPDV
ncbi:serine/threonine protein kinase, variant [Aphanomyces invadans]|uniref:Serine/threonine protein kinase, variant n=1 Tax=Aphanomyces invadans TaxID=157072 RepID=A0A024TS45_9STRA|nr:serine/threonine protein kinase, variant [Aphanomyces invadans]ETV96421.1 serine/threonine protein kinase, variant [Aphanomyces invadans]|eukprot:XP_008874684.1 serine/threonine protein kinase, variant [Aphanomyces invadans]